MSVDGLAKFGRAGMVSARPAVVTQGRWNALARVLVCAGAVASLCAAGCSSIGKDTSANDRAAEESGGDPATVREVDAGSYAAARGVFEVARETLRDYSYMLERVDAASGVITTRPKSTAGIVTPWHPDQSNFEQEWSDFFNRQQRTVRITFAPAGAERHDEGAGIDLRTHEGAMTMWVRVIVERMNRPGRKVDTTSVRMSSYYRDEELEARGIGWQYAVADEEDRALAERLADEILARAGVARD